MSYLTKLGDELAAKLSALPEAEREELIAFVKSEVLTSYRNGQKSAEEKRPTPERDGRSRTRDRKGRTAPQKRRNYQHR